MVGHCHSVWSRTRDSRFCSGWHRYALRITLFFIHTRTAHDNEESDQCWPINFDSWIAQAKTYLGTSNAHTNFVCALLVPETSYCDTFYRNRIAHSLQNFKGWLISRSCEQLSHLRPTWPSASWQPSTFSVVRHYKKSPLTVAKTCDLFFLFLLSR